MPCVEINIIEKQIVWNLVHLCEASGSVVVP